MRPRTLIFKHIVHIRVSVHYHLIAHVHLVHPEKVQPRVAARLTAVGLTSGVGAGVSAASNLLTGDQDRTHDYHDHHTAQDGEHFADRHVIVTICVSRGSRSALPVNL